MKQKYSKETNLPADRQIVEIKIHNSIENFQTGIPIAVGTNSEQKVDEMHFSLSSYANVGSSFIYYLSKSK